MNGHWTFDQEVLDSNLTQSRNLFLSCARSPGLLSQFDKMSTGFRWPRSFTYSWDLKYESMAFADWNWSVIAPALGLKTIPDLLDTITIHTGMAFAYIIAPYTCTK